MIQKTEINFLSCFVANKDENNNEFIFLILNKNESENLAKVMNENKIEYFDTFKGLYKNTAIYPIEIFGFCIWELKDARIPKEYQNFININDNKNILELEIKK